jgi:hypothetical protein
VTGDLDEEESREGRSGNDLVTWLAGCDGGIDERLREELCFFANLSPPMSGKTEVTRELGQACPSPLSNTGRPSPVGTPVRWERAVHREELATVFILHS